MLLATELALQVVGPGLLTRGPMTRNGMGGRTATAFAMYQLGKPRSPLRSRATCSLFIKHGIVGHIRSDGRPELAVTASKGWITGVRAGMAFIEPGSP
ncbi:hypothetical protein [Roseomonas sp. BN140053]|uniref:hypothetical protein n=1 Tax=Roseomonas sp. BN140053 TaxID=3391898 RepID=UPI0039ED0ADA